jgi:hypothetical protein
MRRPHDKNRNREVNRDFTEIEREFIGSALTLAGWGRYLKSSPQDALFILEMERQWVLRKFPFANGPSGLFPGAETAGKIGS